MAPDAEAVFRGPGNHPVCECIIHPGHAVLAVLTCILIQERVGFGLIGAGGGIELSGEEIQKSGVLQLVRADAEADPEAGGFCQLPQRRMIGLPGTGGDFRSGGRNCKRQRSGQQKTEKHFQTDHPFRLRIAEPLYHGSVMMKSKADMHGNACPESLKKHCRREFLMILFSSKKQLTSDFFSCILKCRQRKTWMNAFQ